MPRGKLVTRVAQALALLALAEAFVVWTVAAVIPGCGGLDNPGDPVGVTDAPTVDAPPTVGAPVTVIPPQATCTRQPASGIVPLIVQFNVHVGGMDNSLYDFYWDFGNGLTSSQVHPTTTYPEPGNFTASVRVTGPGLEQGTTCTREITAMAPPPPERQPPTSGAPTMATVTYVVTGNLFIFTNPPCGGCFSTSSNTCTGSCTAGTVVRVGTSPGSGCTSSNITFSSNCSLVSGGCEFTANNGTTITATCLN